MTPDDRKSFSLKIVSADEEVAVFTAAKAQLSAEVGKLQKLDDANKGLFDPVNTKVNQYQAELAQLDGIVRSTFVEQNIVDSAAVKIGNYFFPNDTATAVPSLAGSQNVWTKFKPFATTFVIGKNYVEVYPGSTPKESDAITAVTDLIADAAAFTDRELTIGKHVSISGTCSLLDYTNQTDCTTNGGTWTPGINTLVNYPMVITLKNDLVTAVNALKAFLQAEVALIVTDDKDNAIQAQNNAAINNINNVIIPALNTWLAYPDFNSTGVTAANYNSVNLNTLAPTKLHSTELTALSSALSARTSFIATRQSQVTTVLGSVTQDPNTGEISASSGLYGKRYGFMLLRIDRLNGSLSKLLAMNNASGAQDAIISSIKANKATYMLVVPTSSLMAPGNGTDTVQAVDPSLFAVGDTVYIMAESQVELQRAIKSISGNRIVLNDIVPAKYKTTDKLRIYKDLS